MAKQNFTCSGCKFTPKGVVQCFYCKLTDRLLAGKIKVETIIRRSK